METKLANPAPLGLMGFGMTTVLLNMHNAGFFPVSDMILAMGIFYGGLAQIIAGILEFKKGNTFGMTAFVSYGMFWLTLVAIFVFPDLMGGKGVRSDNNFLGWYLFMWGLFTFFHVDWHLREKFLPELRLPFTVDTVFPACYT